jgi:hypothetical protein
MCISSQRKVDPCTYAAARGFASNWAHLPACGHLSRDDFVIVEVVGAVRHCLAAAGWGKFGCDGGLVRRRLLGLVFDRSRLPCGSGGEVAARLTYGRRTSFRVRDMMIDRVAPLPGCGRSVSLGRPRSSAVSRWWRRDLTVRLRELAAIGCPSSVMADCLSSSRVSASWFSGRWWSVRSAGPRW